MAHGRIPAAGTVVHPRGTLGTDHQPKFRYVNQVASDGWLQAQVENAQQRVALPKYTQVSIVDTRHGRVVLRVEDGHQKGKIVSLSEAHAREFLGSKPPVNRLANATVTYGKYVQHWISVARGGQAIDQQMATLTIDALSVQVTMNSVWDGRFTPIPPGEYKVLLPDAPHNANMTRFYRLTEPRLRFDQVWFPIQLGDNSRFIHVGNVSEGCTTVLDLARWRDVHEALISHRGPDGRSVATLAVRGKPERTR
jgi:hypothetical protein